VKHLARKGAKVYLGARSEEKATVALQTLEEEGISPGQVVWLPFDASSPEKAKKSAETFLEKEERLDVLGKHLRYPVNLKNTDSSLCSQ